VADGGQHTLSPEYTLLLNIQKYGAEAVMGRALWHEEILAFNAIQRIISAYSAKTAAKDWAKWAQDNPSDNAILTEAMKLAGEHGWKHS